MTNLSLAHWRLRNQRLSQTEFKTAAEIVHWLGAVQSQDYAGAKWSLPQRALWLTDVAINQALPEGTILRTHVMRPTWHFVTPADIRGLLKLTAARVHAIMAAQHRKVGLDARAFTRSHAALEKALSGSKPLTRDELRAVLKRAGVAVDVEQRLGYVLMYAELEGLICSGGRLGKQFTYALLDDRAPQPARFDREAVLAELARRYFTSRGPATAKDFAWWSGLTLTDARAGVEMVKPRLEQTEIGGQAYWFADPAPTAEAAGPRAWLLSIYDEYVIGYTDRSAIVDDPVGAKLTGLGNALQAVVVVDGLIVGTWRRTLKAKTVIIETELYTRLNKTQQRAIAEAGERYGTFLSKAVEWA